MLTDEEIALEYWRGRMVCYGDNKAKELAGRRAIESAVRAEMVSEIEALKQKVVELEKDAGRLDWLDRQNADIENDAWLVLAHDCGGDDDCKKYWVGADLRAAIDAAIKDQQNTGDHR